jgi:hypothetical protein
MEDRLETIVIEEGADPAALTEHAWSLSELDCAARPRGAQQRYTLRFFRAGSEERDSQISWLHRGRAAMHEGHAGDTDPPDQRGLVAVALRSMIESNRQLAIMTESVAGTLAQELTEERRQRKALEARQQEQMILQNSLLDMRAERELTMQAEARKSVRNERLFEGLSSLVLLVGGEFLRSRGLNATTSHTRDAAFAEFMKSLNEEQIQGIVKVLGPDQALFVVEALKQFKREHDEREAAVAERVVKDPPAPGTRTQ